MKVAIVTEKAFITQKNWVGLYVTSLDMVATTAFDNKIDICILHPAAWMKVPAQSHQRFIVLTCTLKTISTGTLSGFSSSCLESLVYMLPTTHHEKPGNPGRPLCRRITSRLETSPHMSIIFPFSLWFYSSQKSSETQPTSLTDWKSPTNVIRRQATGHSRCFVPVTQTFLTKTATRLVARLNLAAFSVWLTNMYSRSVFPDRGDPQEQCVWIGQPQRRENILTYPSRGGGGGRGSLALREQSLSWSLHPNPMSAQLLGLRLFLSTYLQ